MGLREAILVDLPRLEREARQLDKTNIQKVPKVVGQGHLRQVGLRSRIKFAMPWIGPM